MKLNTKEQSEALLMLNTILEVKVLVSSHRTLYTIRAVLSENEFFPTSEEDFLKELQGAGDVPVKRIMFRKYGEQISLRHVILTSERHTLPEIIKAGYLNCHIRPYVPNRYRCLRCQRIGHGTRSCQGKETCAVCGSQDHVSNICQNVAHCANCGGPHPTYYLGCSIWRQEKEIISTKTKRKSVIVKQRNCIPL